MDRWGLWPQPSAPAPWNSREVCMPQGVTFQGLPQVERCQNPHCLLLSSGQWPPYQLWFLSRPALPQERGPSTSGDLAPPPSLAWTYFGLGKGRRGDIARTGRPHLLYKVKVVGRADGEAGKGMGEELERTNHWREPRMNGAAHPLWDHAITATEISVFGLVKIVWYQDTVVTNKFLLLGVRKGRLHRRGVIWAES